MRQLYNESSKDDSDINPNESDSEGENSYRPAASKRLRKTEELTTSDEEELVKLYNSHHKTETDTGLKSIHENNPTNNATATNSQQQKKYFQRHSLAKRAADEYIFINYPRHADDQNFVSWERRMELEKHRLATTFKQFKGEKHINKFTYKLGLLPDKNTPLTKLLTEYDNRMKQDLSTLKEGSYTYRQVHQQWVDGRNHVS